MTSLMVNGSRSSMTLVLIKWKTQTADDTKCGQSKSGGFDSHDQVSDIIWLTSFTLRKVWASELEKRYGTITDVSQSLMLSKRCVGRVNQWTDRWTDRSNCRST